ncbi:mitochondrial import receptor subunit TOM20 homolog B, partial [Cyprinus carpio]|uniref:Mitochondrial import receptor subunit TOM20 homolog B n=1 Tax=Cyprinus carpio TaxID=7962 RepID=A0A9Q9ZD28_CYPCA
GSRSQSVRCHLLYYSYYFWALDLSRHDGRQQQQRIAAGLGAALFVAYCIYFDKRDGVTRTTRTSYEERRKKQKAVQEKAGLSKLPDLKDAEAVQKFFLEEIQLGEELLAQGDYERGVDHLTNAIAVCGQPQQLLQVLQQTLPPPVFQMLLTKLPTISQRIVSAQSVSDDDLE